MNHRFGQSFFSVALAAGLFASLAAPFASAQPKSDKKPSSPTFSISSPVFVSGGTIPERYTCDGLNVLPPLTVQSIPAKAKSLAIIIEDPDAPTEKWTHLALWNMPPRPLQLEEGKIPKFATVASNDFGNIGYGGPCPPRVHKITLHHYYFRAYALDSVIALPRASKRMDLDKLMVGHVLAKSEYMGTYERVGASKPPKPVNIPKPPLNDPAKQPVQR